MKNIITLAVTAALSLSLASAFASQSEGGFSIGVKGGYNTMDYPTSQQSFTDSDGDVLNISGKKDKMVGDLHVAYLWPVADVFQLGAQLGYSYYGKYTISGTDDGISVSGDNKISAINLQLVGQWNIQQWFVQARAGAGYFHQSEAGTNSDSNSSNNKTLPIAGLSGGYFFTDNFSGEVFVDHVFGKNYSTMSDLDNADKPPTMTSAGLGITYSF